MSDTSAGSKFATATYEKRFGSWNKALVAFAEYIARDDLEETDTSLTPVRAQRENGNQLKRRTSREINWRLRAKVLIRDACICKMCGVSPAKNPETVLHVDHVLPWSKGGETVEENLQTLCSVCNIGKSDLIV
jgi:5-methylcytosine-specific restriction endonuclease McrA